MSSYSIISHQNFYLTPTSNSKAQLARSQLPHRRVKLEFHFPTEMRMSMLHCQLKPSTMIFYSISLNPSHEDRCQEHGNAVCIIYAEIFLHLDPIHQG